MKALGLGAGLREQLESVAARGYPREVCGLLVGRGGQILRVTEGRNLATERLQDRYQLDPEHFLSVDAEARRDGLDVLGVWHTHPDHPARPSSTDREAAWEGYSYMILSVNRSGVADVRSWQLVDGEFKEQPLEETTA